MFQIQVDVNSIIAGQETQWSIAGGEPITQTNTLSEAREMFRMWNTRMPEYYKPANFRILDLETLWVHPVVEEKKSAVIPVRAGDFKNGLSWECKKRGTSIWGIRGSDNVRDESPGYLKRKNPPFPPKPRSGFGEDYREAQREINRIVSQRAEAFKAAGRLGRRVWNRRDMGSPERRKDVAKR